MAEQPSLTPVVERVAEIVQAVAAPAGAVTGFLLFFGWTYSGAYYGYFGVNQRLLQYSLQDQLLQSAQPMFGTAVILLTVASALWVIDRWSAPVRRRSDRLGRWARGATLGAGLVTIGVGLLSALGLQPLSRVLPARSAALLMLVGALVLGRIRWARTGADGARSVERLLLVSAALLAVFWVTTVYATETGRAVAERTDRSPQRLPLVTVFTERYLDLPGSSVVLTEQSSRTGGPLYRYTGLRLLTYSNSRWFLITGSYEGYRSTVTVVRDDPALRLEVANQR